MEDLSAETLWTPINEKSCQTEDLCHKSSKMQAHSTESGDPTLLQRPLQTSKSGIQQIIECFRTGTTKLKHILLKEVDTIFECKLCRSLFRGLPNLITHKEFYCFTRVPGPDEHSGDGTQSLAMKELLEAIYPQSEKQKCVVRLEPIQGNQNAVFQHLVKEDNMESPFLYDSSNHSLDSWTNSQMDTHEQNQGHHTDRETKEVEGDEGEVQGEQHVKKDMEGDVVLVENEEEEELSSDGDDGTITCSLCGKDFRSRRSICRHCHKMHKQHLEDLLKFSEIQAVPVTMLAVVKDQQVIEAHPASADGKHCPAYFEPLDTKADVRCHFDEVYQHDFPTKPGQLEPSPSHPASASDLTKDLLAFPQYNLDTCTCLLCERTYNTQSLLKRHMHLVHKVIPSKRCSTDWSDDKPKVDDCPSVSTCSSNTLQQCEPEPLKRPREDENDPLSRMPRLSVSFDFRQLFCKLCKRTFSSRQNLTKHIELHTDNGGDIFIKFYCCPLCPYESRRKRDVLRHITVVHKKSSAYLTKILPSLDARAVKKPAEVVLDSLGMRSQIKEEVSDGHKTISSCGPQRPTSPLNTLKQELTPHSLSVTCKQSLLPHNQNSNEPDGHEDVKDGTEVWVTKNFSLHTCDMCSRVFTKKVYLESHKRSHRNAVNSDRRTGVSTRSRSLLGSI